MLSKAKHLALAKDNRIIPAVGFFAPPWLGAVATALVSLS